MIKNKGEYSILAILATIYVAAIFRFQSTPRNLFLATCAFALCYVIWGIIHHLKSHNLRLSVVLEYLLVALLGLAIISTLLI